MRRNTTLPLKNDKNANKELFLFAEGRSPLNLFIERRTKSFHKSFLY
jgi:hypothetical protein